MTITYRVAVDWNWDGYCCQNVQAADPLNLIRSAASYAHTPPARRVGTELIYPDQFETAYGYRVFLIDTNSTLNGGVNFGGNGDPATANDRIPVAPNATYTYVIWVNRSTGGAGDDKMRVVAYDQAGNLLAILSDLNAPLSAWAQYTLTFTTTDTTTHLILSVQKDGASTTTIRFYVAGLMLVAGSSAPTAYNTGSPTDAFDDVTTRVTDVTRWSYGMQEYLQDFAPPARAVFSLKNDDGRFTPNLETSPLFGRIRRGTLTKIYATVSGLVHTLFTGTISQFQIATDVRPRMVVTVEDAMIQLLDAEYRAPLQTTTRTDQIIGTFFMAGIVPYPYPASFIMLDVEGAGNLDEGYLFENRITELDVGATTAAYAGDNAGSEYGISAQSYLREVIASEFGGRFYWDAKAAKFIFHSRHHDALNAATPVAIDEASVLYAPAPPVYLFAEDIANTIEITYEPRKLDAASSVLYTLEHSRAVRSGETVNLSARYRDATNEQIRVGGTLGEQPVAGIDWTANSAADGSGTDLTSKFFLYVNFSATAAEVTIVNTHTATGYLTALQLKGIAIRTLPRETAYAKDAVSIAANGLHKRVMDVPIIDTADTAQQFANYLLMLNKDPTGRVAQFSAEIGANDTWATAYLALDVGDLISLTMSDVAVSAETYVVTGFQHLVNTVSNSHIITLILVPAARVRFGILDDAVRGLLDETMWPAI